MVRLVASRRRRLTPMRVDALNGRHARKQALSRMTHLTPQQPCNRVRVRGVHMSRRFARFFAALVQFKCRTGKIASYVLASPIFQFGLGRLEDPGKLTVGASLAGIVL